MLRPFCCLLAASVLPAFAGEYAVLSSGLRIRAERHEPSGSGVRLITKDGAIEVPASVIVAFEQDDYVPPPPPAPAPPPPPEAPPTVAKPSPRDPQQLVHDAAVRSGLPPEFVHSVAKVESGFEPRAVSPKGAVGVMQLMPDTARSLGADPTDPEQNIDAGTRLLRELLLKYNGDVVRALAAYNAGPGAVDKYQGLPPFNETRQYVNKVIGAYKEAGGQ
ncbi:MAG TPA: lytic transglycosylase domain-containing protein [Bryobacteraceae bacterium]|nr:lytic transglycosylase domain-containing protein [Bryobacteraceae bacterium]